jgi:sugar phosphate isomerase/epimerase
MEPPLKLGFDNYSLRALGWKAPRLLEHAARLKLDTVLFSSWTVYERLDESYLHELRAQAKELGIEIQVGMLSICPSSVLFDRSLGTAEAQLERTMRIAMALGSPIVRCVLGNVRDRRSLGGIEARIVETVEVLKNSRRLAQECGVKIALENHAGDLQSWELVTLIEEVGPDCVGATMDAGNAAWALEDPAESLEMLGPYALTSGIRDTNVWEVENGATLQWAPLGEGRIDWPAYCKRFAEICPETPVQLETISGRPIPIAFWQEGFWDAYRNARIPEFMKFLALAKTGKACAPFPGAETDGDYQLSQLEKSVRYCQEVLGLGRNWSLGSGK